MKITAGAYSFHCTTAGSSANPAVLFLHGFMGSGSDWSSVAAALSHEYYCIAPDLPGHGHTEVHGSDTLYSMEATAQGIAELMRALSIESSTVVGYSMGGRIALYIAATAVLPLRAAVLESSSPGLRTESEQQARRAHDESVAQRIESTPLHEFIEQWYTQPLFASLRRHEQFTSVAERRANNKPAGLALSLRHLGTGMQPSLWEKLPAIATPIDIIAGEHDTKFIGIGREMASLLPSARLHIAASAGHTIHVENEPLYTALLSGLLREHSAKQSVALGALHFSQSTT